MGRVNVRPLRDECRKLGSRLLEKSVGWVARSEVFDTRGTIRDYTAGVGDKSTVEIDGTRYEVTVQVTVKLRRMGER